MSRCKCCGLEFPEENGWQEYCSPECLHHFIVGDKKGKQREKSQKRYDDMLADPKSRRLVRFDKGSAEKPSFGNFVTRRYLIHEIVGKGKDMHLEEKIITRTENAGGEIHIRPMTESERASIEFYRGRSSFGENHRNNSLRDYAPGEHPKRNAGMGWYPHD